METMRPTCPEEQHAILLKLQQSKCFCPYCGIELRKSCSENAHKSRENNGDQFCVTCGLPLTEYAKSLTTKVVKRPEDDLGDRFTGC
jgi:hypothetical protein